MTDIERVRQMVRDGRITEAEGEQLIAVLDGAKEADDQLAAASEEIDAEARGVDGAAARRANEAPLPELDDGGQAVGAGALEAGPAAPRAPAAPATPATPHTPPAPGTPPAPEAPPPPEAPTGAAPAGTRWVRLDMLAGNLDVVVDDSLEEPAVEVDGPVDVIVERSQDGFRVHWDQPGGNFIDKMLSKLRSGNLSVRIPRGYGLFLSATAGDVDLHGVPYLRGHMTAGDLDASGLKGIDFTSRAGDIGIEAELTAGSHRLNVSAGNVEVRLARTSSVRIKADSSIGDISSDLPGIKSKSRGLGESLEGTLGAGAAGLEISVTTGSIELEVGNG